MPEPERPLRWHLRPLLPRPRQQVSIRPRVCTTISTDNRSINIINSWQRDTVQVLAWGWEHRLLRVLRTMVTRWHRNRLPWLAMETCPIHPCRHTLVSKRPYHSDGIECFPFRSFFIVYFDYYFSSAHSNVHLGFLGLLTFVLSYFACKLIRSVR